MRKVKKYKVGGLTPNGVGVASTDLDFLNQNALADMNAKFGQKLFAGKDYRTFNPSNSLNIDNISSGIGGAADLLTNAISSSKQKYDTVKQARMATVSNSLTGLAKGAQAGAAIGGPIGAAIGAGAGLWSGLIGGKNKVSDSGFYEDPTIQYGTGIIGAVGRNKAEDKYQELLRKAIGNRNARAVGQELSTDWLLNYDSENNVFAANGGNVSDLAWLDDGEVFKTPDQQIYNVPEQGKPEDSNLLNIPEGTKVLSDKLKVPGTKETFANMAKRLTSNKSKYNDKYAQGAAEANAINDKIVFDTLFDMQESMKNGKKEYKKGLQEFQGGGISGDESELGDRTGNYGLDLLLALGNVIKGDMPRTDLSKPYEQRPIRIDLGKINNIPRFNVSQKSADPSNNPSNSRSVLSDTKNLSRMDQLLLDKAEGKGQGRGKAGDVLGAIENIPPTILPNDKYDPDPHGLADALRKNREKQESSNIVSRYVLPTRGFRTNQVLDNFGFSYDNPLWTSDEKKYYDSYIGNRSGYVSDNVAQTYSPVLNWGRNSELDFSGIDQILNLPVQFLTGRGAGSASGSYGGAPVYGGAPNVEVPTPVKPEMKDVELKPAGVSVQNSSLPTQLPFIPTTPPKQSTPFDWEQLATDITSLLPVFSNLGERPETFASVHNPYTNAALNTLGRRRYDIRPTIDAIRRGTASANYAMSQNNVNTGANLAFRLQNAVKANNAITGAYADAAIQNNQYAADYANALNNFGQQYVQARNTAIDQNARSRAQARNLNRIGLSQLSNYAQNRLLMRNQRLADQAMLDIYEPILSAGFTPDQYAKLFEQVSRRI